MSALSLLAHHQSFEANLKVVDDAVKYAFGKRLRPQEYEEALAEARAVAWRAWHGLLKQGKDPLAIGVHGIAHNAIRFVKSRRRIGNRSAGRGSMDVFHPRAQQARNFRLISLDREGEIGAEQPIQASWREWLAEDNRVSPADEAAFRLDFEAWLASLPAKKRQVAEMLAAGHDGVVVARAAGISPARVCQLRRELEAAWPKFQGPVSEAPISTPHLSL